MVKHIMAVATAAICISETAVAADNLLKERENLRSTFWPSAIIINCRSLVRDNPLHNYTFKIEGRFFREILFQLVDYNWVERTSINKSDVAFSFEEELSKIPMSSLPASTVSKIKQEINKKIFKDENFKYATTAIAEGTPIDVCPETSNECYPFFTYYFDTTVDMVRTYTIDLLNS